MRGLNDNAGVVAGAKQRNINGATEIRFAGAPGLADRGQNPITGLCATAARFAADPAVSISECRSHSSPHDLHA